MCSIAAMDGTFSKNRTQKNTEKRRLAKDCENESQIFQTQFPGSSLGVARPGYREDTFRLVRPAKRSRTQEREENCCRHWKNMKHKLAVVGLCVFHFGYFLLILTQKVWKPNPRIWKNRQWWHLTKAGGKVDCTPLCRHCLSQPNLITVFQIEFLALVPNKPRPQELCQRRRDRWFERK